jgi:cell division protein FtsB
MKRMSQETPVMKKTSAKFLALTIICIILAAGLVGLAAVYLSNQSQISEKDTAIDSLNDEITLLQLQISQGSSSTATYLGQISSLNQQVETLNQQLEYLNVSYTGALSEYANLLKIVQISLSGIMYNGSFTQNANDETILYDMTVDYAGLVVIQAEANATSTYARVQYTFGDYNFDYNQTLGTSGTAAFPILPGAILLSIGNINETISNTVTAKATFYY